MMSETFALVQTFESEGRLNEAVFELSRLIESGEGGSVALTRRALLQNQLGRFARVTEDLELAETIRPEDPYPWMWQGHIAKTMRRPLFAYHCLRLALDRASHAYKSEMRVHLADLLLQLGWLDEAARVARAVPSEVHDWWAGTRRTSLERYYECRKRTRKLLHDRRINPVSVNMQLRLAECLWSLGRLSAAEGICRTLMKENPCELLAFDLLSRIIARRQGAEAALLFLRLLSETHQVSKRLDWTTSVARLLHDLGRFDEAITLIKNFGPQGHEELLFLSGLAHVALERTTSLSRFSREWMLAAPESVPAGGFLISAFHAVRGEETVRGSVAAPRRLHVVQFWNSTDLPSDVRETMESWRRHNPELDATLFDTQMAARFIRDRYGSDSDQAFSRCRHPAMQADLFRVAFLGEEGGLYADADELCLAPMQALLVRVADAEVAAVRSGETPNFLHNYFMGSRAGAPTMRRAFAMAANAILQAAHEQRPIDIWHATGPGLVTRAVGLSIAERFDTAAASDFALVPVQQYRAFTRVAHELAYKRVPSNNWRLS